MGGRTSVLRQLHIPVSYKGKYAVLIRPLLLVQVHMRVPIYSHFGVAIARDVVAVEGAV